MVPADPRTLLTALRDLLGSAQGLVQHLLSLHGGPDSLVTPPPPRQLALPSGKKSPGTERAATSARRAPNAGKRAKRR
jgi:hypothetical protein